MTTKVLTGTYSSGYALAAPITTLSIAASGYVEGRGVATAIAATASYTVTNDGRIREADSYLANAVYLTHGGRVTNGSAADGSARIEGWRGVWIKNDRGAVTNDGTIIGDVRSGVLLTAGGVVTNGGVHDTGAFIEGQTAGVGISGGAGTLVNFGTIAGEVLFPNGGTITNGSAIDTTATILAVAPFDGVNIASSGTVTNFGTIENRETASYGVGVLLNGVSLSNGSAVDAGASIYGYTGIEAKGAWTIGNFGTIEATGAHGGSAVLLTSGGVLTNGSGVSGSALISGGVGVYAQGAGATVINYGTIAGATDSVEFGSAADVLIADEGAQFEGQIAGGGGTLVVVGGAGTISGLGVSGVLAGTDSATFFGFGAYVIGTTGAWALSGGNVLAAHQSLTDNGALAVDGTIGESARATISVNSGAAITFTGVGSVLAGTIFGAGSVAFAGGADTLNGTTLAAAHMAIGGARVTLIGTITNGGTVAITSPALLIGAGGATLAGGTWALGDSPSNKVRGVASGDALGNASATISGAGMLGGGVMTLINRSAATIDGNGRNALIVDTGANRIANSGLIEATGAGGVVIQSAVLNGGGLEAAGGTLTVNGAVSGPGSGAIASGALVFNAAFSENVTFSGTSGVLSLAQSQAYAGVITGFSTTGGTSLDLRDIGFVSAGEATFSGAASGGVLTVTDGTHTAHINLAGDYLASTFVAASDGHGGVIVHDPAAAHRFIAAAASLRAGSGGSMSMATEAWRSPSPMLARPGVVSA